MDAKPWPRLGTPESDFRHVASIIAATMELCGGDPRVAARYLRIRERHYRIAADVVENPNVDPKHAAAVACRPPPKEAEA